MIANSKKNRIHLIRGCLLGVLCLLLAAAALLVYMIRAQDTHVGTSIYPQVYIDDVNVSYKTKDQVNTMFAAREQNIRNTMLYVFYKNIPIATYSGQTLNIRSNMEDAYTQAYSIGRTPHFPSRMLQKISALFHTGTFRFTTQVQYNKSTITDLVSQLEDIYNVPAKNALFTFANDRVTTFQKEEKGNKVLSQLFLLDVDQSIRSLKFKHQPIIVTLKDTPVEPEIKLSEANGFGIEELLAEGVSNYTHSIPTRIHNVILAASKFNGVLIPKDRIFSFNDTIGDISATTGYQPAYIIKEGKTVLGDGGGVCQVSTTLFRAALNAGLPIIEQHPHAYRVSYYENDSKPGLDATVFAPSVDLKIQNNTPAAILIQTSVDENNMLLYFKLYGKRDGRNIQLSTPVLFDVSAPPPALYQDDPTLRRGIIKQIDFPAWGGKATFDYKVTKANEVLFEKHFFSAYKPWQAIYLVGTQD